MTIYDEQARTNKQKDEQAQGQTDLGMNTVRLQMFCVSLSQWNAIAGILKKYSYDQSPNPVYFDNPFSIIYFSVIETLIRHTEIEFNGVYLLRVCRNYDT